jgi:hypothetical protein
MSLITFGSGTLWGIRTDIANATPIRFGALQDVDFEFSATNKELYGQNQFPIAVARGKGKATGKAKFGMISGNTYAQLLFGATPTSGQIATIDQEADTIPATTPFTVTVANSATWTADLGVSYAATGLPLKLVTGSPATGQYSVAAGVYTFAAADEGMGVLISYKYTIAAIGQQFTITNQLLGVQPVFQAFLRNGWTSPTGPKNINLQLNACIASKLGFPTKQDDFMITSMDFDAFADASNIIGMMSFSEVS